MILDFQKMDLTNFGVKHIMGPQMKIYHKLFFWALAGVAQWIECQPVNQRVAGSIPSQDTCLGCRPGPRWGAA